MKMIRKSTETLEIFYCFLFGSFGFDPWILGQFVNIDSFFVFTFHLRVFLFKFCFILFFSVGDA